MADTDNVICYGHQVPSFQHVFPKLFRAGLEVMTVEQIAAAAGKLPEADRLMMGDYLGPEGVAKVLDGLASDKSELVSKSYASSGSATAAQFRTVFPKVMTSIHNTLNPGQVQALMAALTAEDIASQSLFFGDEGRAQVFQQMRPDAVKAILDHTEDWVFLETGKRAVASMQQYGCMLEKQERVDRKLQGLETITLKYRDKPRAMYMKWEAGPFKGRELMYNEASFGAGKLLSLIHI